MAMLTFFVLNRRYPFWENLFQKTKMVSSKLKFGTYINLAVSNLMVMFTFSISEWNIILRQMLSAEFDDVHFFYFGPQILFLENLIAHYHSSFKFFAEVV